MPLQRKRIAKIFMGIMLLLLLTAACGYNIPTFSHQGRLMTADGKPVNGDRTITYKLYHEATGGTAVYTQNKVVSVNNGYFNSDFGTADVDPKLFATQTWLEITINGETLTPRQRLRAAPYAASLLSGSAIIGSEPITYTYGGVTNLGSSLIVFNNDDTPQGGSGVTAVIKSSVKDGESEKMDVAAIKGLAIGGTKSAPGSYAAIFHSSHFRALYAKNGDGNSYAAWFSGDVRVTGHCNGCSLAMTSKNIGEDALMTGDLVAAAGVEMDEEYEFPVMLVRKAGPGDKVIGVVSTAMKRTAYHPDTLAQEGYDARPGPARQNDFVEIGMEGLVQARLPHAVDTQIGDFVMSSKAGVQVTANALEGFGQVMSAADDNGLTWLLINR